MRQFNQKGGIGDDRGQWLAPHAPNESDVEADQHRAAREWLRHVENGQIGGRQ